MFEQAREREREREREIEREEVRGCVRVIKRERECVCAHYTSVVIS